MFYSIFPVLGEYAYVPYCWSRSKDIVRRLFPKTYRVLGYLVPLFPLVCYAPLVGALVYTVCTDTIGKDAGAAILTYSNAVVATLLMVFDLVLVSAFIHFQRTMGADSCKKLVIIAQHGLIASFFGLVAIGFFGATAVLGIHSPRSAITVPLTI
ncbi:hypothetical protein BCR33DRAFT_521009 [Rhizoclosmatium globosum]|uniref:Uncharacterized protein n=1 Tax=Rhizoclosmatium globosum TaxID=329046 RepID=A0A1Y2BEF6_9FUNG|nr:hypothetical protein BCR33DRAFT_521009 [Rhizoclosmatium globosum]|eukprot:ORY33218.1 hypothetical protein BCR33DRAFT_521009 [Rhizoclosmatium globosum]